MKHLLLSTLLAALATGCQSGPPETERVAVRQSTARHPGLPVPAATTERVRQPAATGQPDTIDHFFFTDRHFQRVAALNQLDMLRLDSLGTLDVCGRDVGRLHYKTGDTTADFLAHNLTGMDSLPLGTIRLVAWSSDLRGNDETFFFFKAGRLWEVREQNAPDLSQLLEHR